MGSDKIIFENQSSPASKSAWVSPALEVLTKDLIQLGAATGQPETFVSPGNRSNTYYS